MVKIIKIDYKLIFQWNQFFRRQVQCHVYFLFLNHMDENFPHTICMINLLRYGDTFMSLIELFLKKSYLGLSFYDDNYVLTGRINY